MELATQLALFLDNKPGTLARIASALADAEVNIEYVYSATSPRSKNGLLVMRVSNYKKAMKVLNSGPSKGSA
jgi:hypothetical protein